MRKISALSAVLLLCAVPAAQAKVPFFNATCGNGIEVHAEDGGYVWINGKQAELKTFNSNAYEAKHGHDVISITINLDGSVLASWTGQHGANGICTIKE